MTDEVERTPVRVGAAKARILAAALELFTARGFRATSVRDIMNACGLSPGALYAHYGSKESVLFELMLESHRQLDSRLAAVEANPASDPAQRLPETVYQFVMYRLTHTDMARIANADLDALTPTMLHEIMEIRTRIGRYFESAYEAGVVAGEFESRHQALTLRATLASANKLTDWFDESGPTTREEIARWHAAMILRVVMCPRASASRIDKIVDRAARASFPL